MRYKVVKWISQDLETLLNEMAESNWEFVEKIENSLVFKKEL